tara:strand:- start:477 stop:743 length:267 start_codon:yes stop_codon:yes gene_type:complete
MSVIWLDDECALLQGRKKQKVGGSTAGTSIPVKQTTKTASVASMSSTGSFMSRASARSTASSNCSFAPLRPSAESEDDSVVRIAIGGL